MPPSRSPSLWQAVQARSLIKLLARPPSLAPAARTGSPPRCSPSCALVAVERRLGEIHAAAALQEDHQRLHVLSCRLNFGMNDVARFARGSTIDSHR